MTAGYYTLTEGLFYLLLPLLAVVYCIARAIVDVRRRQYWWAAAGFLTALAICLIPIQTHAVKITLPVN